MFFAPPRVFCLECCFTNRCGRRRRRKRTRAYLKTRDKYRATVLRGDDSNTHRLSESMDYSERRTNSFLEFRSTSPGIERLPENWLKKLSQLSLLVILVISSAFTAVVAPPGRGKMQFSTEQKQEFEDSVTQSSSESTAYSSYDLTAAVKERICSKKHLDISTESACNKLWHPQNATEELLEAAKTHRKLVDDYCAGDVVPGCHPVPTVLHISRLCNSTPANIQNYDQLRTVVMRCPKLPCCKVTYSCKAKTTVDFQVTFKALYSGKNTKILTIPLRNDTECECRESPTKCPKPFRTTKDSCTCNQKSKTAQEKCEQIENGRQPLNETERRCVEKNKCRLPLCTSNLAYDTRTGLCIPACRT